MGRFRERSSSSADEVEHALVGPLDILEDQHRWTPLGDALEERAPRGEQLVARARWHRLEGKQGGQAWFDPAPLLLVRQPLDEGLAQTRRGGRWIV